MKIIKLYSDTGNEALVEEGSEAAQHFLNAGYSETDTSAAEPAQNIVSDSEPILSSSEKPYSSKTTAENRIEREGWEETHEAREYEDGWAIFLKA